MEKISVVVIAKNEEGMLGECLSGLQWCDEVVVIDDDSTDRTGLVAGKWGARVVRRSLKGDFAKQRNFGLECVKESWVLFVDADERVSEELRGEVKKAVQENGGRLGFYLRRVDVMWGKELNFGETGRVKLLRLARKNAGRWERRVDEVWLVAGETGELKTALRHFPHQSVSEFLNEVNFKSSLNAEQFMQEERSGVGEWAKPVLKFFVSWILWGGWRDGMPGFLVAMMMSFHSFLVRSKMYIARRCR